MKEFIAHPDYDPIKMEYDYAIIRTTENIVFSPTANAACLPTFKNKGHEILRHIFITGFNFVKHLRTDGSVKRQIFFKIKFQE